MRGCFSYSGVGNLVKIDGKMTGESYVRIIDENLKPSAEKMGLSDFVFQQDNDPKHTSRVAQRYFEENEVEMIEWPPQSPDLNPIEQFSMTKFPWNLIKIFPNFGRESRVLGTPYQRVLCKIWWTAFLVRRLQAVIESRGGHIKC